MYRHFDTKESLYRAVLQRVFDRLAEEFLADDLVAVTVDRQRRVVAFGHVDEGDAVVELEGRAGRREIPVETFHRLPGDAPDCENLLGPGEMIVAVRLPAQALH